MSTADPWTLNSAILFHAISQLSSNYHSYIRSFDITRVSHENAFQKVNNAAMYFSTTRPPASLRSARRSSYFSSPSSAPFVTAVKLRTVVSVLFAHPSSKIRRPIHSLASRASSPT